MRKWPNKNRPDTLEVGLVEWQRPHQENAPSSPLTPPPTRAPSLACGGRSRSSSQCVLLGHTGNVMGSRKPLCKMFLISPEGRKSEFQFPWTLVTFSGEPIELSESKDFVQRMRGRFRKLWLQNCLEEKDRWGTGALASVELEWASQDPVCGEVYGWNGQNDSGTACLSLCMCWVEV